MGKLRNKNGFQYTCDKTYFQGYWFVTWRFRPDNEEIYLDYQCDKEKTLLKDIEELLANSHKASDYYYKKLIRVSDVDAARQELKQAEARYSYVHSPDFDLRGNNPNREVRAQKDAQSRLTSAMNRLQIAIDYSEKLKKSRGITE